MPTWSVDVDGELILFTRWLGEGSSFDLYTIEPNGENLTQTAQTPDIDEYFLDWGAPP